jgi:predicted Zn finger-like uncharacterized protein
MIISCTSCGTKYKYDDAKLDGVISKKVRCPKCKTVIEVFNPLTQSKPKSASSYSEVDPLEETHSALPKKTAANPVPSPAAAAAAATAAVITHPAAEDDSGPRTAQVNREAALAEVMPPENEEYLKLPEYRRFSLAVIQGFNAGEIFPITKVKMLIGRSDSDIIVKDLEASRQHARIDIMGDRVILRDLNSTNGTFVNEQRITTVNLDNQQEFRIGTTVFMLIITDLD